MGASPNPFAALSAMLAAKSPGGAGTGATGTGSSDSAVGNASTQLQGADPKYALKELMGVKQTIANYITSLAFRVPAASRALSSTLKGLDSTIKELQQAQATLEAVGGPVSLSSIPQPQPPGAAGGAPQMGTPSGGM